jgi:hypothetical protein
MSGFLLDKVPFLCDKLKTSFIFLYRVYYRCIFESNVILAIQVILVIYK